MTNLPPLFDEKRDEEGYEYIFHKLDMKYDKSTAIN